VVRGRNTSRDAQRHRLRPTLLLRNNAANLGACLDQHKAEMSEACKAGREAKAMGKEEGTHAQPGAQPLTKADCKKAGMKWDDQSNVCGKGGR